MDIFLFFWRVECALDRESTEKSHAPTAKANSKASTPARHHPRLPKNQSQKQISP
jgi:hypothetical protein